MAARRRALASVVQTEEGRGGAPSDFANAHALRPRLCH